MTTNKRSGVPDGGEFTVRACGPADAALLAALGARLFAQAYGPTHPEPELSRYLARTFARERLAEWVRAPGGAVFLAEDPAGRPIGYAALRVPPDGRAPQGVPGDRPLEITRFYVDAGWHGRGVAGALMAACADEARRRGADALWLDVWQEAARPIAFYRRSGFDVVGTTTFEFGERRDTDFVMARRLSGVAAGPPADDAPRPHSHVG